MELDGIIDTPKKDRRRKRESMSDNEFAAAGDSDAGDTDEDENQMKGMKPKKRVNSLQSTKRPPSQSPKTPGRKDTRLTLTSAPPSKSAQQQGLRGRASRTVQKQERAGKKTSLPVGPVRGKVAFGKSIQEPNNTQNTRRVPVPKQKPANVPASISAKQQGPKNAPSKKPLKAAPKASESKNGNLQDAKSSEGDTLASITTQPVTRASSSGSHSADAEHSPLFPSIASDKEHGPSTSLQLSALTQDSMINDTTTSGSANSTQSTIMSVESQYTIPNNNTNTSKNKPRSALPTTNPSQKSAVDDQRTATSPQIKASRSTPPQALLPSPPHIKATESIPHQTPLLSTSPRHSTTPLESKH
jgi:hypothetical protein